MIGRFFQKRKNIVEDDATRKAALLDIAVEEARANNPVVHLKTGADELVNILLAAFNTEHGVHIESLLGVLGSLAGFCCVDSALKQATACGQNSRDYGIVDVGMSDGTLYYFGDPINALLTGDGLSLWALVAGIVNHLGSQDYADMTEIARHVASTLGRPEFGIPRVAEQHKPGDLPVNYVRDLWPHVVPLVERRVPVLQERVALFGFAIQNVIERGKDVIPVAVAGKLVMECAVPMSKLDPAKLWV